MYVRDHERASDSLDPQFDSLQLDLPLRGAFHEVMGEDSLSLEWRSAHSVLTEYLTVIGVSQPHGIARALLGEFGSLSDLLAGSFWRLRRTVGSRVARAIQASKAMMTLALSEPLANRPVVPSSSQLQDFLRLHIGHLRHERLLALYVDTGLHLLAIEKVGEGSISGAPIDVRKILFHGLRVGASGILLVHNHPSGDPRPSTTDLQVTRRLRQLIEQLDMFLLDHLVIARDQVASIEHFWREARYCGNAE